MTAVLLTALGLVVTVVSAAVVVSRVITKDNAATRLSVETLTGDVRAAAAAARHAADAADACNARHETLDTRLASLERSFAREEGRRDAEREARGTKP